MNAFAAPLYSRPWMARVVAVVLLVAFASLVLGTGSALAQEPGLAPDENQLTGLTDSSGVPAENYRVPPIDRGGFTAPEKMLTAFYVDNIWGAQVNVFNGALWLFQWLLSFGWVNTIASPFIGFATIIENVLGGLNFIPFALALTALVYGMQMMRGKYAHSAINMLASAVVAVLLAGVLANPATAILGPNGLLNRGVDFGSQLAVAFATDGEIQTSTELSADDVINQTVNQQLTDIFLREPAMYVGFGKRLTGECAAIYDEKMREVKAGDRSDNSVRDAVTKCDPDAKFFVENPSGQLDVLIGVGITLSAFFLMAAVITLILLASVVILGFKTIVLLPKGMAALLPGESRGGFWHALAEVLTAITVVALSLVAMVLYLRFVIGLMEVLDGMGRNKFMMLGVAFAGGAVFMFMFRRRLIALAGKASQKMTGFMGTGKDKPPTPVTGAEVMQKAQQAFHSVQSWRTANALSRKRQGKADRPLPVGGGSPSPQAGTSSPAGPAQAQAPGAGLGPKAQMALGLVSKIPGAAPYATAAQVAAAALPAVRNGVRDPSRSNPDTTHRTGRNERLRGRLSTAELKEVQRLERAELIASTPVPRGRGVHRQDTVTVRLPAPAAGAPRESTEGVRPGTPAPETRRAAVRPSAPAPEARAARSSSGRAEELREKLRESGRHPAAPARDSGRPGPIGTRS